MDDSVSIIIPIYNGERYLSRCLESVLNQSYKNIEIILIDDNSTDSSPEITKQYMANSNVKYVRNEQNMGPAQSRNKGLLQANSKYILFLDCDDWIDLNCIEKAIEKFESDPEIDIVLWEIKTAYESDMFSSRYKYLYNNILSNRMALSLLTHTYENEFFLSPLLGCKLFKKSLIDNNNIIFPDTIYEDDMFTYLSFLYAKKVALITGSHLYYYQHPTSITHHFTNKNIDDFFITFKQLYTYIENEKQKDNYYKYLTKSMTAMINNMTSNVLDPIEQSHYKAQIFLAFYQNVKIHEYYRYSL